MWAIKIDFRRFISERMWFGFYVQCWPQTNGLFDWAAISIGWAWNAKHLDDRSVPWHRCYDMTPRYITKQIKRKL